MRCRSKLSSSDESNYNASKLHPRYRSISDTGRGAIVAKVLTATPAELRLEALEVSLVLDDLDERHGWLCGSQSTNIWEWRFLDKVEESGAGEGYRDKYRRESSADILRLVRR